MVCWWVDGWAGKVMGIENSPKHGTAHPFTLPATPPRRPTIPARLAPLRWAAARCLR